MKTGANLRIPLTAAAIAAMSLACGDTPTEPPPTLEADLLSISADPGNGAIVTVFTDDSLVLLTLDGDSGLFSVHYSGSAFLSAFLGCAVPTFTQGPEARLIHRPTGGTHVQSHGDVYVLVYDLAGFPANVLACDEPLAEGTIRLSLSVGGGGPGNAVGSFSSNGVITDNSDGGDVRLHHRRLFRADGSDEGTVRLR
ncbi:MAG: hypothetical protein HKN73_11910 [Gemmatimonadetes bacterium]|nr:hypothetical protein [Gemmatimonadota bacterium]